jgi:hypothetical protein
LLTHVLRHPQLVKRIIRAKPEGFLPNPYLYIFLLISTFTTVFLIPFASNTPSFMTVSILSRALPFSFLMLPYVVPTSWGIVHTHPHSAHYTYTTLFRTISAISAFFHLKATVFSLFYNTSENHYYRHSLLRPLKEEHLSALNRGYTAVGRLFGAIREHPAVGAVGWDVILSGLSLGVWAAVRGLDATEMLGSSMVLMKRTEKELEDVVPDVKVEDEQADQKYVNPGTSPWNVY